MQARERVLLVADALTKFYAFGSFFFFCLPFSLSTCDWACSAADATSLHSGGNSIVMRSFFQILKLASYLCALRVVLCSLSAIDTYIIHLILTDTKYNLFRLL